MKGNYIYMFLDKEENPLYVGMSKNLTSRILINHFSSETGNLDETCLYETSKVLFHKADCADDMKIKERYLINVLNPKYNKHFNNNSCFSYRIDVVWSNLNIDVERLLKKRKEKIQKKTINHVCEIKKGLPTWLPFGVNIEEKGRNYLTIPPNFDLMNVNPEYDCDLNTYFIKINGQLFVHNFYFLSYYTANYKEVCKSYGLDEKQDFLSVICPTDNKLFKDYSDYVGELGDEPLSGVCFMRYEVVNRIKIFDKEVTKYYQDKLSIRSKN